MSPKHIQKHLLYIFIYTRYPSVVLILETIEQPASQSLHKKKLSSNRWPDIKSRIWWFNAMAMYDPLISSGLCLTSVYTLQIFRLENFIILVTLTNRIYSTFDWSTVVAAIYLLFSMFGINWIVRIVLSIFDYKLNCAYASLKRRFNVCTAFVIKRQLSYIHHPGLQLAHWK